MPNTDYEKQAADVVQLFSRSRELVASMAKAQAEGSEGISGTGGSNSSAKVLEKLRSSPFALTNALPHKF